MNSNQPLCALAFAAMVSFAASALAAEPLATDSNTTIRVAAANVANDRHADARALADYAGRYETQDGVAFLIDNVGDALTIELPTATDSASLRLRVLGAADFLIAETGAIVRFETDRDGRVRRLLFDAAGDGAVVAADKIELRGVVTIHDVATVAPVTAAARVP
jgi:hypothetical protein